MTSMAPYFNVAPRFAMPELPGLPVSEEDRQRALLRNAYDSAAPRGPVPAMMSALSALRSMPEAAPAPRMVSGGDVIGLMPEQSAALMDRIQRQNEIDQQMYQQRSLQSLEEAMTREGRVMSAREAQQRRAQEFAIEQAKLKQEDERDKAKMSRPTYQPISSNPGYLMKIQTNPDTNEVSAEVVKAGGVAIPDRPRQGWIDNPDGSKVWGELTPGTTQAAPAQSQEDIARLAASQNINQRQWEAHYRDFELNGKPLTAQQISDIASYKADPYGAPQPELEAFLAQLTPRAGARPQLVATPDPNDPTKITWQPKVEGGAVPQDPTPTPNPQELVAKAIRIIRTGIGLESDDDLKSVPRKRAMKLLEAADYPPDFINKFADDNGLVDNIEWGDEEQYYSPSTPAAPQGAAQPAPAPAPPQPVERTLKDGTKVMVVKQPDGTWKEAQ